MAAVLFSACLEAFQAQARSIPDDVEFPGLDWEGWQAIAETLGISGTVDAPIFRTRQAVKIAVSADAANLRGDRVKFGAVEERLCDILSGGASMSQVPDTQAEEMLLQPARARVVLRERRKRGRHAVTSYYLVFDNHPEAEGAWVTQGELRRHFPAAWQSMIAEYNQRRAAGTLLEPSPPEAAGGGDAAPEASRAPQPTGHGAGGTGMQEQATLAEPPARSPAELRPAVHGGGGGGGLPRLGAGGGVAPPPGMPVAPRNIPLESQPEAEPPLLYSNQSMGGPPPPSLLLAGVAQALGPPHISQPLLVRSQPAQPAQPAAHGSGFRAEQAAGRAFFSQQQQQQQQQLATGGVAAPAHSPPQRPAGALFRAPAAAAALGARRAAAAAAALPASSGLPRSQTGRAAAPAPQPPPGYKRAAPPPIPPPGFRAAAGGHAMAVRPQLQQPIEGLGARPPPGRPPTGLAFFGGGEHPGVTGLPQRPADYCTAVQGLQAGGPAGAGAPSAGSTRLSGQAIIAAYRRRPAAQIVPAAAALGPPRPPPGYKRTLRQQAGGAGPPAAQRSAASCGNAVPERAQRAAKRPKSAHTAPAAHMATRPDIAAAASAAADEALHEAADAAACGQDVHQMAEELREIGDGPARAEDEAELAFLQALPVLATGWEEEERAPAGAAQAADQATAGEDDFYDAQEELQQESSVAPDGRASALPPPLQLLPRTQPDEVQFTSREDEQGMEEVRTDSLPDTQAVQAGEQAGAGSVVVPDTEAEAAGCDAVQAHAQQQQQARQEGGQKRKPAAAAGGRDVVAGGEQEQHAGSAGEDEGGIAAGPGVEEEEEELEDELAALAERLSQATIRGAKVAANGVEISVQWPDGVRELILSSVIHDLAREGCPGCCALSKLSQFYESKVRDGGGRPKKKR